MLFFVGIPAAIGIVALLFGAMMIRSSSAPPRIGATVASGTRTFLAVFGGAVAVGGVVALLVAGLFLWSALT